MSGKLETGLLDDKLEIRLAGTNTTQAGNSRPGRRAGKLEILPIKLQAGNSWPAGNYSEAGKIF